MSSRHLRSNLILWFVAESLCEGWAEFQKTSWLPLIVAMEKHSTLCSLFSELRRPQVKAPVTHDAVVYVP